LTTARGGLNRGLSKKVDSEGLLPFGGAHYEGRGGHPQPFFKAIRR